MSGRFAPSPTGPLHVGNLRTALIAWVLARRRGDDFRLRMEDLDRVTSSVEHERSQRADLAALGIDWDGDVWRQSERFPVYDAAIARLAEAGLTYECYCSRREVRESASAPHGGSELVYGGRCRDLDPAARLRRRAERPPAIRFRAASTAVVVDDLVVGAHDGRPWDVVLRRNDGVPAYNLAVVVDDAASGVDLVVRGDDLLGATPSQVAVGAALGLPAPQYAHVGLVTGPTGGRLAKRDGATTLAELDAAGTPPPAVLAVLAASIGLVEPGEAVAAAGLVERADEATLLARCRAPFVWRSPGGGWDRW